MGYFYTDSFGKERYAWDAQDERMSNSYRGADKNTRTVFNTPGSNIGHDIFNKNSGERVTPESMGVPTISRNGNVYNAMEGFSFPSVTRQQRIDELRQQTNTNNNTNSNTEQILEALSGNLSLNDLANRYLSTTVNSQAFKDKLISNLGDTFSRDNLDSLLQGYANWTGSGRQGSGLQTLNELLFNKEGQVVVDPYLDQYINNGNTINSLDENLSNMFGNQFTDPAKQDGGFKFETENQDGNYLKWDQLTPEQQHNIYDNGLFPNIKLNSKYVPDSLNKSDLGSTMTSWLQSQGNALRNTGQKESEGYLLNQGLPTLFNTIGTLSGMPFFNLAGSAVNTTRALDNGNIGSAILGGINMYNTAGNIANTSNFNNTNEMAMGNEIYEPFNPQQYLTSSLGITNPTLARYTGNAGVEGIRAALDGDNVGSAITNSIVRTGVGDLANTLGLNSTLTGILQQGLPYLFNQTSNSTPNNSVTPPVNNNQGTNTNTNTVQYPTITQQPYVSNYNNIQYQQPTIPSIYTPPFNQPMINDYLEDSVDDESDTNNPYNTPINYGGSGRNVYG